MPLNVLVSLGPDEASFEALRFATNLYAHVDDAEITVVHVGEEDDDTAQQLLDDAEELLNASEFEGDHTVEIVDEESIIGANAHAGSIVTELVERREIDHVFMGRPTKSVFKHLLDGSATNAVLDETQTPVTLVGTDYDGPVDHIEGN